MLRQTKYSAVLIAVLATVTTFGCSVILDFEEDYEEVPQGAGGATGGQGGMSSGGGGGASSSSSTSSSSGSAGSGGMSGGGGGGVGGSGGGGMGPVEICTPGTTKNCYTGSPGTENIGVCLTGTATCSEDGMTWGACEGQITDTVELCDGLDNDCDGTVDDEFGQETCGLGPCQVTVDTCLNGAPVACNPLPMAVPEVCDATQVDEDCDGEANEGCDCIDGETAPCYSGPPGTEGVGQCAGGTKTCVVSTWGPCEGEVVPEDEACDGTDNNCDGQVDEGLGTIVCGVGACQAMVQNCVGGLPQTCNPGNPVAESCNGVDDDCNGSVDDGLAPVSCGMGVCIVTVPACTSGQPTECTPKPPSAEVCDGIDNNCNGQVDEGNPEGGGACNTGLNGVCAVGTMTCQNGSVSCKQNVQASNEVCDGLDNDCDGSTDVGVKTTYYKDNDGDGYGDAGNTTQACSPPVGYVSNNQDCNDNNPAIKPGAAESCDNVDNDCDGLTDESLSQACYTGSGNTSGVGECKPGTQTCSAGVWSACVGQVVPTTETCNSKDDDCDGTVDESNPGGGAACTMAGQQGVCSAGTTACTGGAIVCNQNVQSSNEVCDAKDNDCDGSTDEGNPGGGVACTTGQQGVCSAGTTACTNGAIVCNPNVQASNETCDAKDNDCDGSTDEGNPGGGLACNTGQQGVCSAGTTACTGGAIVCNPNVQSSNEICDAKDNDCDGSTDEGNPGGGLACSTGQQGVCSAGTTACTNGAIVCNQNVQSSNEICDSKDNDCDGLTDEGNPGGGVSCTTGQPGVCSAGTTACTGGAIVCNQNVQSSNEICDGKDNDCNGSTDEGNPGGGVACTTGLQGVCSAGTTACSNGAIVCNQNVQSSNEVCDSKDNDCDGLTDEGNPGGGGACTTGLSGVCNAGTKACVGGTLVCNQNVQSSNETCDGKDNDCDGSTDEGNPGGGVACTTGLNGVCSAGTTACTNGAIVCNQNVQSSNEICDSKDNDCDGLTDEGNPGGGVSCNTGQPGVCGAGTTSCSSGAIVCNQNVQASNETCDGKDNDCDGLTDEGNPGGGGACTTGQPGVCSAGTMTCTNGAIVCSQNVQPTSPDHCADSLDTDCDGQINEDCICQPSDWLNCFMGYECPCTIVDPPAPWLQLASVPMDLCDSSLQSCPESNTSWLLAMPETQEPCCPLYGTQFCAPDGMSWGPCIP